MKVKKSQRLTTTSLNKSYSQLCFCIAYVLLTICLLESIHVDAYINGTTAKTTTNVTNSFQYFNIHHRGNVSKKIESSNRIGRFLFDAFFGIDTPPLDATDFDDDDDEDDEPPKPCKCGKTKQEKKEEKNK